jgi:hypothetical protein
MKTIFAAAMLTLTIGSAHAESTVQRDAPTIRFYDARGNVTGSASTYGNVTKFYAPDGRLNGSATRK